MGPDRRRAWGCDEPTSAEQDRIPCYACDEDTLGCPRCEDLRWVPLRRCPKMAVDRETREFALWAIRARDGGPLPVAGGLADQTAMFVSARDVVLAECHRLEAEMISDGGT